MLLRSIIFIGILLLLPFSAVTAQSFTPQVSESFTVRTFPQRPAPGQDVTMSVRSFSIDLAGAEITWFVNDEVVRRGIGVTDLELTAGALGSEQRVLVRAVTDAVILEEEVIIRPTRIDLIWESADAYAPPLYRGKTLVSYNGTARIVALPQFIRPDGSTAQTNELVFTWSRDGRVLGSKSGTGRNAVVIDEVLPFRETPVSVEVRTLDNELQGSAVITIEPVAPSTVLYQDHPLLGILFNRALGSISASRVEEFVARAYPYFASAATPSDSELTYEWSINNRAAQNPSDNPSVIVLRRSTPEVAGARIDVSVAHTERILQRGEAGFILEFGTERENESSGTNGVF